MSESVLNDIVNKLGWLAKGLFRPTHRTGRLDFYMPKTGQLQFSVSGPKHFYDWNKWSFQNPGVANVEREGAVFLEGAPPLEGTEKLDWANKKIIFAIGDKDIGELLWGLQSMQGKAEGIVKITHAPEDDAKNNNKTFTIKKSIYKSPRDGDVPQWQLILSEIKDGQEKSKVSAFIKGPDMMRLKLFLETSLPYILGFHKT